MAGRSCNRRDKVPTVDTCRFVTTAYGVVVYDKKEDLLVNMPQKTSSGSCS